MDPIHDLDSTSDILSLLSDATRMRLMALLGQEELTVAEVMSVTQLGQSKVSTHLGKLKNAGLLRDRRAGASVFYAVNEASMPPHASRVWTFLSEQMNDPLLEKDRERCLLAVRARASGSWADAVAGEMERHYSPGRTWEATARGLIGLIRSGAGLDVGSGDGTMAELLATQSERVACVDVNPKMIAAGRERLAHLPNVTFHEADMHELPFGDASFDRVLLFNSLTYAARPARALAEASRVLRPGGQLSIVTLKAHKHELAREGYNHVHLGFEPKAVRSWLTTAGLIVDLCQVTSRERREPHFEVLTIYASHASHAPKGRARARRRS